MGIRQQAHHFTGAQRTGGRAVEWTSWWLRESFHWGAKVWKPDQSISVLFLVCLKMWDTSNLDKNQNPARLIKHQIGRSNRLSDPCTSGGGDHQCSTSQPWLKAMAVKAALQEVETPLVCHSAWVQILGALEVHAYVSGIITIQVEIDRNNIKYNPNIYAILCNQFSMYLRAGARPWDQMHVKLHVLPSWDFDRRIESIRAMIRDEDESVTDAYMFYRQVLWDRT